MYDDSDIKIVGDKPSDFINKHNMNANEETLTSEEIADARKLGEILALHFLKESQTIVSNEDDDSQMLLQRKLLLSFTVTVALDKFCRSDAISGISQKSFLDKIKKESPDLYSACSDTGAFSFYYLAYRRKNDIERRMGQTFAMLCSHDGDPIYQELGEALYCWFSSVVKTEAEKFKLN